MGRKVDLVGKRFERLLVVEDSLLRRNKGTILWKCLCNCGNYVNVRSDNLRSGKTKSCGCLNDELRSQLGSKEFKDLTNMKFERLTVLELYGFNKHKSAVWKCLCDCGNIINVSSNSLQRKHTMSCGCLKRELDETRYSDPKWYMKNAFNKVFIAYKNGAKRRNYTFNLTQDDVKNITQQNCHYCGCEPKQISKSKNGNYIYNGIDRVNNSRGYELDNVVPCCAKCNRIKTNMNLIDLQSHLEKMLLTIKNSIIKNGVNYGS